MNTTKAPPQLTKAEYNPINSSRKLNLLLQRSLRYSYRQRCCGCCPTILCELLFPIILILLVGLARYGTNALARRMNDDPASVSRYFQRPHCSQDPNTSVTLSKDLLEKCLKFPPSYASPANNRSVSMKTNIIFQPMTNDTKKLVEHAQTRLEKMKCQNTAVW
jgi:hypothetical protein